MSDGVDNTENLDATEETVDLGLTEDSFSGLLISPADWTIGSLCSQIGKQIDLNPEFQRRNVWPLAAKSKFIESLFLGIPVPQILLSAKKEQKNTFLVLDGKQRLLTLKQFIEDGFTLRKMRVLKALEGKRWSDIKEDEAWHDRLMNETLRTAVIRNWGKEEVLYEVFYRLNSESVKLSPMELRMSLHPGPFLKFIVEWTEEVSALHRLLGRKSPDPRMADVELSIRFLAFSLGQIEYCGDLKKFLDESCQLFNEKFTDQVFQSEIKGRLKRMLAAIDAGIKIFPERRFCRKFSEGEYESRFNRAVFDVQVGALSDELVRTQALADGERFKAIYETAAQSPDFIRAVEATTKTPEATRNRFQIFYNAVNGEYGTKLTTPPIREAEI